MFDIGYIICSLRLNAGHTAVQWTMITRKEFSNIFIINTTAIDCKLIFNMINYKDSAYT